MSLWDLALGHAALGDHERAVELMRRGLERGVPFGGTTVTFPHPLTSERILSLPDYQVIKAGLEAERRRLSALY